MINKVLRYDEKYHNVVLHVTLPNGEEELWVITDVSIFKNDVVAEDEKGPHISRYFDLPDCPLTGRKAHAVHSQLRPYVRIDELDEEAWALAEYIAKTATCRVCEASYNEPWDLSDE